MLRTLVIVGVLIMLVVGATVLAERNQHDGAASDTQSQPVVAVGEDGTCGGQPLSAPRELRGMWMASVFNIDWPSRPGLDEATVKAEYLGWLDVAQRNNHNAIYVQVRPSGDAFWPSQLAPWSEWLTGRRDNVSPGWDPMEWMVAQTHARDIEFHAWFNPYLVGQRANAGGPGADLNKLAPNHVLRLHPEWAITYPAGTPQTRLYVDPGIPAARTFVVDSILEAVIRYDIDGVDFDDFFYPYPSAGQDFPDGGSFATYGQGKSKADWRRDNVNSMIKETNERIKAAKPWVKFGISPFGIWKNRTSDPTGSATSGLESYSAIYADTVTWVKHHWIDSVTPQLYWNLGNPPADYTVLVAWWSSVVEGTGVQLYIAHGDYRIGESGAWSDPGEIDRQMTLNAHYKVDGTVHFSAKSVRNDPLGAVTLYRSSHYAGPALMPRMAQLPVAAPATPTVVSARAEADGRTTMTWRPGVGTPATSYAVYRLDPGATSASLIATVRAMGAQQSIVDITVTKAARYCVSGLDRSANESRVGSQTV